MANKTVVFNIPSLVVDKDFLKSFGEIIEPDVRGLQKKQSHIYSVLKPFSYSIRSKEEINTYVSMKELLGVTLFPKNVTSMTFRVNPYNENYVTVEVELHNQFDHKVTISSSNEAKIALMKEKLNNLFDEYKTQYNNLYKIVYPNYFILQLWASVISFVLSLGLVFLIGTYVSSTVFKNPMYFYLFLIPLMWTLPYSFEQIFPRFLFKFSKRTTWRIVLKNIVYMVIWPIILATILKLLKLG